MEAIVSSFMDKFHIERKKATLVVALITAIVGLVVCLGYNVLYFDLTLPNGTVGQVLDVLDYISNYVLMPIVAIATCILIGWMVKPKTVIDEVTLGGCKFGREKLYIVMIKYITPVLLAFLFLQSVGILKI